MTTDQTLICPYCNRKNPSIQTKCMHCSTELERPNTKGGNIQPTKSFEFSFVQQSIHIQFPITILHSVADLLHKIMLFSKNRVISQGIEHSNDKNNQNEEHDDAQSLPGLDEDDYSAYVTEEHIIGEPMKEKLPPMSLFQPAKTQTASDPPKALPLSTNYHEVRDSQIQTEDSSMTPKKENKQGKKSSTDDREFKKKSYFYRLNDSPVKRFVAKNLKRHQLARSNSDKDLPSLQNSRSSSSPACVRPNQFSTKSMDPDRINSYLRLLFNLGVFIIFFYLAYLLYTTVVEDIQRKRNQEFEALLIKRDQCAANYKENKCDPPTRVKRLEHFCIEWEQCMTLDPESAFRKTALTASIVSEIISNFVDPLSAKSIIVVMFFIFGFIIIINCLPTGNRHKNFSSLPEMNELNQRVDLLEKTIHEKLHASAMPFSFHASKGSASKEPKTPYMFNSSKF